jgi:hypothetical protein
VNDRLLELSRISWQTCVAHHSSDDTFTYQVTVEPGITITAARTTSRDIRRHKPLTTKQAMSSAPGRSDSSGWLP